MMRFIVRIMILIGLAILLFIIANSFVNLIILSPKKKYALVFLSAIMLLVGGILKDKMDN